MDARTAFQTVHMLTGVVERGTATRLHIVDLAGAKEGRAVQTHLVRRIVDGFGPGVQIGGGVRSLGLEDVVPPPAEEERKGILDLFRDTDGVPSPSPEPSTPTRPTVPTPPPAAPAPSSGPGG